MQTILLSDLIGPLDGQSVKVKFNIFNGYDDPMVLNHQQSMVILAGKSITKTASVMKVQNYLSTADILVELSFLSIKNLKALLFRKNVFGISWRFFKSYLPHSTE